MTLTVIDVQCGNKGNVEKVLVCHNGHVICVAEAAVAPHLTDPTHQDQLGTCSPTATRSASPRQGGSAGGTLATVFEAYPNPFTESTTIRFRASQRSQAQVQVFNTLGQVVATLYDKVAEAGELQQLTLASKSLPAGVYTCRLVVNGQTHVQKLLLLQ